MRQRLFKVISCIALMVSVFLFSSGTVLASDYDVQFGLSTNTSTYLVDFAMDNMLSDNATSLYAVGNVAVPIRYALELEGGYVYNGKLMRRVTFTPSGQSSTVSYGGLTVRDVSIPTPLDGVSISFQFAHTNPEQMDIYIYFRDVYVPYDINLQGTFVVTLTERCAIAEGTSVSYASYILNASFAADTAGILDASLPSEVNLGGVVSGSAQEQMQQQQQIANQQSQQSAQQHENLVNGFDNSAIVNSNQNLSDQLGAYEAVESDLVGSAKDAISNITMDSPFTVAPLASAFSLVSTVLSAIFNSLGLYGVIVTFALTLTFVLMLIGYTRFMGK